MTILELFVFAITFSALLWMLWQAIKQEMRHRKVLIEKDQRQTQLYERLLAKLDECEDC